MDPFILLAGTANPALAQAIADQLNMPLGKCSVERFPDGETSVQLLEPVRHKAVFIVQSTSPPVNEHLVELLAFVDACRRSAAARVTAIIPYFGYARSDKRHGRREPIAASMVATVLQVVGVDHVVTLDLHASQMAFLACDFGCSVDCNGNPAISDKRFYWRSVLETHHARSLCSISKSYCSRTAASNSAYGLCPSLRCAGAGITSWRCAGGL